MALTKITSRILDSSGITTVGTISTGVWQGTAINQTYLVGQSGTNTGDETLARINALDITELGTISSGVWNGTAIDQTYLVGQSGTNTGDQTTISGNAGTVTNGVYTVGDQTIAGVKTFSSNIIVGDGHFIGDDSFDNLLLQSSSGENLNVSSANDVIFYTGGTSPSSLGTQRLRIFNSSGNATFSGSVALGGATVANGYLLEISSVSSGNIMRSTRGSSQFSMYQSNNSDVYMGTTSNNRLRFLQNDGDALTIDTNKNIGIGTTSPSHKLSVKQNSYASGSDAPEAALGITIGDYWTTTSGAALTIKNAGHRGAVGHASGSPLFRADFNNATGMILDKNGNLGIGTATLDANANLTVFGSYQTDFIRDYYGGNRGYILRFGANTASSGHVIGSQILASLASDDINGSLEFYTKDAGNLRNQLTISSGGDATFSNLIKTPQGIVLQGNGIPSGKTGLSSAGDGNHMRFYIGGVHTVTGMTTSEIVHEVQSTTGIRYQQNANEAIRRKEIFKAFSASGGASSANWCRLYIPHFYANGPQGVRAEIKICYHPVHASNAAYYEYVLYTSSYTAARPMYAKVRLVHQETGFGWNYYSINNAVNFAIGDTSGNVGRYIYMNIVGGHSSYNKARSVHIVATGGANISDLTLDTGVAAPSVSAAITIGGGAALSPG